MAKLLIIDDSEPQRAELRRALEQAGLFERIFEAEDGIRGLKLLMSEPVDLVVCDLEMPGLEGDKLIGMSSSPDRRPVPFLMLTAVEDAKRHAKLFEQGARDVITKPFHPLDMIARIQLHLELMRLQDELMEKNRLLERLSTTDSLTGLPNRRHLDEALEREFRRATRGAPLCALMIDIDHFKSVNDSHGHATGDAVLRAVARTLAGDLRLTDVGGRYGGEEFLILLGSPIEGARTLGERMRLAVGAQQHVAESGADLNVTISVGIAAFAEGMADAEALVAAADAALYRAKAGGRNQVVVAAPPG